MKPGVRKRPIYDIEPNEVERDLVGGWPCARIKRDDDRTMNMSKLLYIKASPRGAQSKSSAVADAYRTALRTRLPDLVVDALELAQEGIPDFDDGKVAQPILLQPTLLTKDPTGDLERAKQRAVDINRYRRGVMRFEDKVAAITGGGSGIGKETAKRFVAEGGKVAINGRDVAKLEAAAHEIDRTGTKVVVVAGDVANPATGVALVDAAVSRFGRLNVLANNAGVFTPKPFLKLTEADYDWNVDNILKGSFFVAQAAAKAMKETGGAIVQTGSMWAIQAIGATPSSAYSAAKAGVHALVRNLAIELAPHKIRVTAVAPAVVETPVFNTFLSDQQVKEVLPTFNAFHPLGRNGQPRDVAEAILFLASDDASWITGVVLPVDGGVTAGR